MPFAVVQDWVGDEADRSTRSYDAIHQRLMNSGPIDGFLLHTAGFTGRGFRVFEVWETREQYERFVEERLMPIVREASPPDAPPPEVTIYELHGFGVAPQAAELPAF